MVFASPARAAFPISVMPTAATASLQNVGWIMRCPFLRLTCEVGEGLTSESGVWFAIFKRVCQLGDECQTHPGTSREAQMQVSLSPANAWQQPGAIRGRSTPNRAVDTSHAATDFTGDRIHLSGCGAAAGGERSGRGAVAGSGV